MATRKVSAPAADLGASEDSDGADTQTPAARIVRVPAVFIHHEGSSTLYVKGDVLPDDAVVGEHIYTE
jgi:hypothetical protein